MDHGLGDSDPLFVAHIENIPPLSPFDSSGGILPLCEGDINAFGLECGNGWRKVFNVYAKVIFALNEPGLAPNRYSRWQDYRDQKLLQQDSATQLLFHGPSKVKLEESSSIHVVMGKGFSKKQWFASRLQWLDANFAVLPGFALIVCPYFDYRQLTNQHIVRLVEIVKQHCLPLKSLEVDERNEELCATV